jgi:hypothetical protein
VKRLLTDMGGIILIIILIVFLMVVWGMANAQHAG